METSNGFLVLNKPAGLTSFKVLRQLRKRIPEIKKLGHAGTLDAFATGVLICLAGTYTGLSNYFMAEDKQYRACIEFGKETDTLDPEGAIIKTGSVPNEAEVRTALAQFKGTIMQIPPNYSALHTHGIRAYERALRQEVFELPPRPVTIYNLFLENWTPPYAVITVHCSKGTYIRALARDIGAACNTCAYVIELVRMAVGAFCLDKTITVEEAANTDVQALTPQMAQTMGLFPVTVTHASQQAVLNGQPLWKLPELSCITTNGRYALFNYSQLLLGIVRHEHARWHYEKVMAGIG